MKRIVFTFFVLTLLAAQGFGQATINDNAARLQTLVEQAALTQPVPVHVLENESAVQISDYVIPLAETTLIRWEKQKGRYAVNFLLQEGTAITRIADPTFRRAYWALPLASKQACQEFIALFNQLRVKLKKG